MNAGLPDTHPSIHFYDSDYPGHETAQVQSNLDETLVNQGLAFDVERYKELAEAHGGPVLELCCGTGRVAIPLARAGHEIVAVDLSRPMLDGFERKLAREDSAVRGRVTLVQQDATVLSLERRDFAFAVIAFNSLCCITDPRQQIEALRSLRAHLRPGGVAAIDCVNPLILPIGGDPVPKPFFTRRHEESGSTYTRFAAIGPIETTQKQRLFGWYDEVSADGLVRRTPYSMHWRPIFRYELELMLDAAGLDIVTLEGGHQKEPFTATSPRLFVTAVRRER
jgi:SAM-dependent methyltransferase